MQEYYWKTITKNCGKVWLNHELILNLQKNRSLCCLIQ